MSTSTRNRLQVAVIGGTGHVGSLVARAFVDRGHSVIPTSRDGRSGSRRLALGVGDGSEALLEEFRDLDAIVDCSDSSRVSPSTLVRELVARKIETPIFQTSADPHRLSELAADVERLGEATPSIVVGVGVYPGLSNLLAARVVEERGSAPSELDLFLSWSIWSAAGSGTCALMVDALSKPNRAWVDGELVLQGPIHAVRRTPSFAKMPRWGMQVGFPEVEILQRSTKSSTIRTTMVPRPGVPWLALRMTQWAARVGLFRMGVVGSLLRVLFRFVRRGLLRGRRTGARIAVRSRSEDQTSVVVAKIDDAFAAAAHGTVGIVEAVVEAGSPRGLHSAEELIAFDDVAPRVREMGTLLDVGRITRES